MASNDFSMDDGGRLPLPAVPALAEEKLPRGVGAVGALDRIERVFYYGRMRRDIDYSDIDQVESLREEISKLPEGAGALRREDALPLLALVVELSRTA